MTDDAEDAESKLAEAAAPSARAPYRVLALDVGDRRIGVALSDPLGYTAQPLLTLYRGTERGDMKSIGRLIRRHGVTDVVIGLPLHASGDLSPQAVKTQSFAEALRALQPGVRIHLLDERLTTAEAHELLDRSGGARRNKASREERTAVIDQVAAVLLLEAFLSRDAPRLLPEPPEFQ